MYFCFRLYMDEIQIILRFLRRENCMQEAYPKLFLYFPQKKRRAFVCPPLSVLFLSRIALFTWLVAVRNGLVPCRKFYLVRVRHLCHTRAVRLMEFHRV